MCSSFINLIKNLKKPFWKSMLLTWVVPITIFIFIFLGTKFYVIATFGNATPYWDQWSGEALSIFKPFLEGTLTLGRFFIPHNEHRILITRVLALFLLKLNGIWDPLLEMRVNAVLHLFAVLVTLVLLIHTIGKKTLIPLFTFALILFSIPYGWQNTLWGFQSQFYFVLLFSVVSIFLLIEKTIFSFWWWLGVFSAVIAFFSLASGAFVLVAAGAVFGIQYVLGVERSLNKLIAGLLFLVLFLTGVLFTPTVAQQAPLKAGSLIEFTQAFVNIMSWPLPGHIYCFLFTTIPGIVFCVHLFVIKPDRNDRRWFLTGLVIWTFAQAICMAYGRAHDYRSSHYLDLYAFSLLVNMACLLYWFCCDTKTNKIIILLWSAIVLFFLFFYFCQYVLDQLVEKREESIAETINIINYQYSGDINDLKGKPFLDIPYPDVEELVSILSSQTIQNILPANIHKAVIAEQCDGSIDTVNSISPAPAQLSVSGVLRVSGWVVISAKKAILPKAAYIVLTNSRGKHFYFETQASFRPDIGVYFKNSALNHSGYNAFIDISQFSGEYILGIAMKESGIIKICPQFHIPITIKN